MPWQRSKRTPDVRTGLGGAACRNCEVPAQTARMLRLTRPPRSALPCLRPWCACMWHPQLPIGACQRSSMPRAMHISAGATPRTSRNMRLLQRLNLHTSLQTLLCAVQMSEGLPDQAPTAILAAACSLVRPCARHPAPAPAAKSMRAAARRLPGQPGAAARPQPVFSWDLVFQNTAVGHG